MDTEPFPPGWHGHPSGLEEPRMRNESSSKAWSTCSPHSTPWCQAQRAHRKVPGAAGGAQDTHTGLGMKPNLPAEECSSPLSPLHLLDEFHTNKDLKAFFSLMITPYIRELFMNSNTEPHSKELHLCSCPKPLQKMETASPPLEREEEEVIPLLIADNLF